MFYVKKADYDSSNIVTKLDEFFSEQNEVTSVVREALQNVIDAAATNSDEAVKARFSFGLVSWEDFKEFIVTDDGRTLNDHWSSPSLKGHAKDFSDQPVKTLIIEDFNTTGLTGSFDKDLEDSDSNLIGFWWNSGHGKKGKGGTLGNAGVGKIAFTAASAMRTMWAISTRLNDDLDPKILLGYTDLPYHHVEGQSYLGYARYGVEEQRPDTLEKCRYPITQEIAISRFENAFGITRNEPGLSLIIPAVSEDFTSQSLVATILEHYFWAIINKKLIVEVIDEAGETLTLDPDHIGTAMSMLHPPPNELIERVKYAAQAYQLMNSKSARVFRGLSPKVHETSKKYVFNKEDFTPENLNKMRNYFDQGEMIMVEFAIPIFDLKENRQKTGILNIFFQRTEGRVELPKEFMRMSISLTRLAIAMKSKLPQNVFCFVMIEDPDMSDFVLSAEDVTHTNLTKTLFRKKKLFSPEHALTFVSEISFTLFSILNRSDEENNIINNFGDHIFSMMLPTEDKTSEKDKKPKPDKEKNKDKDKDKETIEPDVDPVTKKVTVLAQRELVKEGGFEVHSINSLKDACDQGVISLPIRFKVKCAYLTLNGPKEAWKLYSKIDFDLEKNIQIIMDPSDGVKVISKQANEAIFECERTDFNVKLIGFDPNRDLLTKISIEGQ